MFFLPTLLALSLKLCFVIALESFYPCFLCFYQVIFLCYHDIKIKNIKT